MASDCTPETLVRRCVQLSGDVLLGKRDKAPYPNGKQKMAHVQALRPGGEQLSSFSAGSAYRREMVNARI